MVWRGHSAFAAERGKQPALIRIKRNEQNPTAFPGSAPKTKNTVSSGNNKEERMSAKDYGPYQKMVEDFGEDYVRMIFADDPPPKKRKHRERTELEALRQRLNRVEGQVRGVRKMLEEESYCTDILTQVSAIQSALNAFSRELLSNHIRTCVVTDIQNGNLEVVDDLLATIQKLMK